jgi:hypothetical protein
MNGFINEQIYNWTAMKKMKKKLGFSEWERFVKWIDIKTNEFTNLQLNGFIKFVQFKICSK